SGIVAGEQSSALVKVHLPPGTTSARLSAWVDWNNNGSFTDESPVAFGQVVTSGNNSVVFNVPANAVGQLYTRFRLAPTTPGSPLGSITGGEVEDYLISVFPGTDFGDAPASYGTRAANNGASHTRVSGLYLA